jgi:hypothetical protein
LVANNELEGMWIKAIMVSLKVSFQHIPGLTDETHEHLRTAVLSAEK